MEGLYPSVKYTGPMARYFTLAEAQQSIPKVESLLRDALAHKAGYQKAQEQLDQITERVRISGGARVNPGQVLSLRAGRDGSVTALKRVLEEIGELGALVKDLDIGLIDFMTLYQNREVCLCWKLGEDAIRFWHGAEEGFAGRKPIDDQFVKQHRGEPAH